MPASPSRVGKKPRQADGSKCVTLGTHALVLATPSPAIGHPFAAVTDDGILDDNGSNDCPSWQRTNGPSHSGRRGATVVIGRAERP